MIFTGQIRLAIDTATRLHNGQARKDHLKTPAISHPYGVAMILAQYPDVSEDTIIAGLLHDVIEDVPEYSQHQMTTDFGPDVLEIVQGVSDDRHIIDWQLRKAAYLRVLETARVEALQVSAADMIHNLSSFIDEYKLDSATFGQQFTGTPDQMIWFYGERAGLIHKRLEHPIADAALDTFSRFEETLNTKNPSS